MIGVLSKDRMVGLRPPCPTQHLLDAGSHEQRTADACGPTEG